MLAPVMQEDGARNQVCRPLIIPVWSFPIRFPVHFNLVSRREGSGIKIPCFAASELGVIEIQTR
jgi:hypothetical protein